MSDQPNRRPSKGTILMPFRVGSPVGTPLIEWAHVTPRYPEGVRDSALRFAETDIQLETAVFWFLANLRPYDLTIGGPWFGWGEQEGVIDGVEVAGFGVGKWAPTPVKALEVIKAEFGDVLPPKLIQRLGNELGPNWMWIVDNDVFSQTEDVGDITSIISIRIESLTSLFLSLQKQQAGIGHNSENNEWPVSNDEIVAAMKALDTVKLALQSGAKFTWATFQSMWLPVYSATVKLGTWAAKQVDTFVSGFVAEAGPALGRELPKYAFYGAAIWAGHGPIIDLASRLLLK